MNLDADDNTRSCRQVFRGPIFVNAGIYHLLSDGLFGLAFDLHNVLSG